MPRLRKVHIHGTAIEICTSIQEGLPLRATPYLEFIIKGVLAAAQTLYPITICHFVVMTNHVHLLCVVKNPAHVSDFMRYFKTELAHALNRLFGWTGTTLWNAGYDSPVILSSSKLLERMYYLYLNPVRAGLVNRTSEYPGLNSYSALISGVHKEVCKKLSRSNIPEIPPKTLSLTEQKLLAEQLNGVEGVEYELVLEPWAWLNCFQDSQGWDPKRILTSFLQELTLREDKLNQERRGKVIGVRGLITDDPRRPYRSKRSGRRMICLSDSGEQRKAFISWYQAQCALARDAILRWRKGILALPPPGFFLPGGVILASLLVYPISL